MLTITSLLFTLYIWYKKKMLEDKYEYLLDKHKGLQRSYDATLQYNKQYNGAKYWFSLIRNHNRSNIIIASTGYEKYVDGVGFAYSEYVSAVMYGDGVLKVCMMAAFTINM